MSEPVCRWPHAWMTEDDERALVEAIAPYVPFIRAIAWRVGRSDESLVPDLKQEALVMLWSWGADRIIATEGRVVRGAIVKEMLATLRADWRARGGWRRIEGHLAPWSSAEDDA